MTTENVVETSVGLFGFILSSLTIQFLLRNTSPGRKAKSLISHKVEKSAPSTRKLLVVTRIHGINSSSLPPKEAVLEFVLGCSTYANHVLICLGIGNMEDLTKQVAEYSNILKGSSLSIPVTILPINPWGYFTSALNHAVAFAQDQKHTHVVFQSMEFRIDSALVFNLAKVLDSYDALMVGPAIEGHEFQAGFNEIRGRLCPWNTFAIWDLNKLKVLGFPIIADGTGEARSMGGVEEVMAVVLHQNNVNKNHLAIMVQTSERKSDHEWNTNFEKDPKRAEYHERKMRSKDERPAMQLSYFKDLKGVVYHMSAAEFHAHSS